MKKADIFVFGMLFGQIVQYSFPNCLFKIENGNLLVIDKVGISRIFPHRQFLWEVINCDI